MKKLIVSNICIDMDQTLTYERNNYVRQGICDGCNYPQMILIDILMKKFDISNNEAVRRLVEAEKPCGRADAFFACRNTPEWGIKENILWNKCKKWQEKHLFFYKDAIYMVKELYQRGFKLFMASNNGSEGLLLKLSSGGLATKRGSKYFKGFYGDDLLGCRKSTPVFFRKLIKIEKFDPSDVVMIGDSLQEDYLNAWRGGFRKVIIVNRRQKERIIEKKAILVNTLKIIPDILELSCTG